jgi:hypothetical protein
MNRSVLALVAVAWALTGVNFSAQQTWTGALSDSLCNVSHMHMAQQLFPPLDDPKCTLACVEGGGKFVFVEGEKVYQIANQDFADLKTHPGVKIVMTGTLKGDVITVTKVEPAPAK